MNQEYEDYEEYEEQDIEKCLIDQVKK